ncbi:MAG: Plasmid stabilization system [Candidatus Woesebacteria bacterium GW2011_GWA1_33_30]|uniref:Plasmid stabilization system n=1 Tax=Candidatus Woesebacteria bacterium GW2011_GWA2_33_28 TaxID=1618561 RepID=A0A0G0CW77_9BACT|nr:MAG: Plasmid stabilization system [Candidatus Woesebacteria bacterium GW2011_GWA2_33_28]KKP48490.1 MAG: Plasmid stabilization system [Candidatus Woesebacteria bacterium GW2011_GWA1_33_30]KKP49628.1 MAG: Plasmid stabilization system [Microgenomates group bacterium GW2011_GWC1_33_32]KKP52245.1 MAG: Plasmid stabilization system [Candidatus Woesebacteria bacterium GW2011_GWB1_33_38]KKP58080.1 MAG: Plasmid stabilization system [Microgenomates group bacterium GW2011_GWD1_33_9]
MRLTITSHAEKQIKKLPKSIQIIITSKIRNLINSSFEDLEKLSGYKNYYKARTGTYRIIFVKFTNEVEIILVAHRKEVYNLLARL